MNLTLTRKCEQQLQLQLPKQYNDRARSKLTMDFQQVLSTMQLRLHMRLHLYIVSCVFWASNVCCPFI